MSDGHYEWWAALGAEPEMYQGPFDSREQAILQMEAEDGDIYGYTICESDKRTLSFAIFDGGEVVEKLEEHNEECWGEDGAEINPTSAQYDELERALGAVLRAWMRKHELTPPVWAFGHMRNMEYFPPTKGPEVPVDGK